MPGDQKEAQSCFTRNNIMLETAVYSVTKPHQRSTKVCAQKPHVTRTRFHRPCDNSGPHPGSRMWPRWTN
eukprot:4791311-Karenia_brevis.AAC.1